MLIEQLTLLIHFDYTRYFNTIESVRSQEALICLYFLIDGAKLDRFQPFCIEMVEISTELHVLHEIKFLIQ